RAILQSGMESAPNRPANHPMTAAQVDERIPELESFRKFRKEVEDTLIQEIKAAMKPSAAQLYLLGGWNPQVAGAVDVFNTGVYGQKPAQVLESTRRAKRGLQPRHALYVGVRLGLNSVADQQELTDIVAAIKAGGGDGVMFYNYSES